MAEETEHSDRTTEANEPPPALADLLCLACGYNLRGLRPGGVCPECGLPVERTLRGGRLYFAEASYLRALLRGSRFVITSAWVALFGGVLLGAWAATADGHGSDAVELLRSLAGVVAVASFFVLAPGIFIAGWLLLTRRDDQYAGSERALSARRLTRLLAILLGVAHLIWIVPMLASYFAVLSLAVGFIEESALVIATMLAVHVIVSMRYVQVLNRRLCCASIRVHINSVFITLGIAALCFASAWAGPPLLGMLALLGLISALAALILYFTALAELGAWFRFILRHPLRQESET